MKEIFTETQTIVVPGNEEETIDVCVRHFIQAANHAIKTNGFFAVALSGGSTPKAIFKKLSAPENRDLIDYKKVFLFWSDERDVLLDDPESNYKMAMDAGFSSLLVPKEQIFPMRASENESLEKNEALYETILKNKLPNGRFDLVMLGMGDDGHTASLFPHTKALQIQNRLVVANEVPSKKSSRLTLTFKCINEAKEIVVYILGKSKAEMVKTILKSSFDPEKFPIQGVVGTQTNRPLFILDEAAASLILQD